MKSFQIVENKIKESDFFLGYLEKTKGPDIVYFLSAYLSAARSITFALQVAMKGIHDFDEWYNLQQQKLKEDPIASYLLEARNYTIHEGGYAIYSPLFFSSSQQVLFFDTIPGKKQLKIPKEEIVKVCRQYMITLLQITRECFQKFGYIIDPVLHFDYIIASKKKTLEDIEYELGFPRGWTKIEGISEEQRRQMLRHEFEKDIFLIDYIFNKYLGTDRLGY